MSLFMPNIAVVLIAMTDGTDGTGELKTSNANNGGWWLDSKRRCRLWGVLDLSSGEATLMLGDESDRKCFSTRAK